MELHQIIGRDRRLDIIREIAQCQESIGGAMELRYQITGSHFYSRGDGGSMLRELEEHAYRRWQELRAEYDPMCDPTSNGDLEEV